MKIVFRALLLFIAFMVVLSVVKYFFVKLFFLALWIAAIAFLLYIVSAILKKT